jgi:cytochrome c oxidase assembly factor 3
VNSFNSSYYGKDYRAGAALLRARRPYLVKNALTGLTLCGFVVGVCTSLSSLLTTGTTISFRSLRTDWRLLDAFTIRAVGQEDFSDVVVPSAPAASQQQK